MKPEPIMEVTVGSVVDACVQWNEEAKSDFLLHDKKGLPYTMSSHKSEWSRLQLRSDKAGIDRFTYHDLKAKGYTDQVDQDAGHMSPKMHKVYDRRGRLVKPADGELPL